MFLRCEKNISFVFRVYELDVSFVFNYLVATGFDTGLLLNFGADSQQIKRK